MQPKCLCQCIDNRDHGTVHPNVSLRAIYVKSGTRLNHCSGLIYASTIYPLQYKVYISIFYKPPTNNLEPSLISLTASWALGKNSAFAEEVVENAYESRH